MKIHIAAAGALLLGTSALAFAPGADVKPFDAGKPAAIGAAAKAKPAMTSGFDAKQDPMAWADSAFKAEPAAWTGALKPAPADGWAEEEPGIGHADITFGDWEKGDAALAKADFDDSFSDDSFEAVPPEQGKDVADAAPLADEVAIGGPIEDGAVTDDALQPRPATRNYPPCDPGPGDDNCIQLYEPGVRMALAAWNAPTGGLVDNSATTAMGGPYEPAPDEAIETAAATADDTGLSGVGGPVHETGYPPCSGSPDDDRCIQLYEPGVTGAGN